MEYVSLAGAEPRTYAGHAGLREVWEESELNWERFEFAVEAEAADGVAEVTFRGVERLAGGELAGTLWFVAEGEAGRIERLRSALDAARLR